jgi:hypothetical protein
MKTVEIIKTSRELKITKGRILRVADVRAAFLVSNKLARYVPKLRWKKLNRDKKKNGKKKNA